MTFLDFQGTRCWCDDLTPHIECSGDPRRQPGYLYVGKLHIERVDEDWPEHAKRQGLWHLAIYNLYWITDDLEALEHRLYNFAVSAGHAESPQ
jgi:hypothetical protein